MSCDQRVQLRKREGKEHERARETTSDKQFCLPGQRFSTFPKTGRTKRVSNNLKLNEESTHNNKVFLIWSLPGVFTNYCLTSLRNMRNMVKINRSYLPVAFVRFQCSVYAYVRQFTFVSISI